MTSKEFWEDEPRLFDAYRISFEDKQKTEDEKAWLIGYYVYMGVQINLYNMNKKSTEAVKSYPTEPITWRKSEKEDIQASIVETRENKIKARLNKSKKILEEGKAKQGQTVN